MDTTTILAYTKARLGISSTARDQFMTAMIDGIVKELEDVQGLSLSDDNPCHVMFVVDYANYRYMNPDSTKSLPRHLQFRLHNLIVKQKAGETDVS